MAKIYSFKKFVVNSDFFFCIRKYIQFQPSYAIQAKCKCGQNESNWWRCIDELSKQLTQMTSKVSQISTLFIQTEAFAFFKMTNYCFSLTEIELVHVNVLER